MQEAWEILMPVYKQNMEEIVLSWNRENRACRGNALCQKNHKSIKRKTIKQNIIAIHSRKN